MRTINIVQMIILGSAEESGNTNLVESCKENMDYYCPELLIAISNQQHNARLQSTVFLMMIDVHPFPFILNSLNCLNLLLVRTSEL